MERIVLVLASLLLFCQISSIVAQDYTKIGFFCNTHENYTKGSAYETNLKLVLSDLASKSSSVKFYFSSAGDDPNIAYALFLCREDISLNVCNKCIKSATEGIITQLECPLLGEGIDWYYECMLRFSNRNISSKIETINYYKTSDVPTMDNYEEFSPIFREAINEVIDNASLALPHFGYGETDFGSIGELYTFAQCTPDIDASSCTRCLKVGLTALFGPNANVTEYGVIVFASCYLLYSTTGPFLNQTYISSLAMAPASPTNEKGSRTKEDTIYMVIGASFFVGLAVIVVWFCWCRRRRSKEVSYDVTPASPSRGYTTSSIDGSTTTLTRCTSYGSIKSDVGSLGSTEFVQYFFATLRLATNNFSDKNKLGKGGFGTVYKGELENGDELAIKRLSGTSSGQGTKEFMAEASLLAKLQHKNLVKLLGFCVEGEEKLLVYEFLPNASLDGFLFNSIQRLLLHWEIRFKIIKGIARGLLYLHQDSRLTIIHRDLKPGNILLDDEMNPKIADFGLAKLFDGIQKFGNTSRIAGTIGYMAPEYMTVGEYSDKSDVYSFGIMLLEIVSGQSNIKLYQSLQKEDLPLNAWRLWNEGHALDLADPELSKKCSSKDVIRCIQIGLLCLHANPDQRPTMESVLSMLTISGDLQLMPSRPAMSFPQFDMPSNNTYNYSRPSQSDIDNNSTNSVSQDWYTKPR